MALYTFTTNLLSAQKTGSPNLIGTSLSGTGVYFLSGNSVVFQTQQVVVRSLSTTDVGIAFNPVYVTIAPTALSTFNLSSYPLSTVNVLGSVFTIPTLLGNSTFGVAKTNSGFSVFPWLSTTSTVLLSSLSAELNVSTTNTRRLRILGYK